MLSMDILEKIKREYRIFIEITFVFSLLLAIGYAYGYWSAFNVNIFPYLTLSDLIKSTAHPLLLAVPYLLSQWFIFEMQDLPKKLSDIPFIKKINPDYKILSTPIFMAISLFIGIYVNSVTLTFGIPTTILIFTLLKKNIDPSKHQTIRILLMLGLFVFFSVDYGKYNAKIIYNNTEYSYSFLETQSGKERVKYLGYINNHYFFMSIDNHHLFITSELKQVILEKFLRKHAQDNTAISLT